LASDVGLNQQYTLYQYGLSAVVEAAAARQSKNIHAINFEHADITYIVVRYVI